MSWKGLIARLGLSVFGVVIALAILEGYLRLVAFTEIKAVGAMVEDAELGWRIKPGEYPVRTEEFAITQRINTSGFHDTEFDTVSPDLTIIALGDSHTFATGVDRQQTWPNVLEHLLNEAYPGRKTAVHNFGVPGYSIGQEYFQLMRDGLKYNPQVVILAFSMVNDAFDILPPARGGFIFYEHLGRKYFELEDGKLLITTDLVGKHLSGGRTEIPKFRDWAVSNFRLYRQLSRGPLGLYAASILRYFADVELWPSSAYVLARELSDNQRYAWNLVDQVLGKFQDDLTERQIKFVLVVLPYYPQVYDHSFQQGFAFTDKFSQFAGNERVKEICNKHKFPCLDVTWAMRRKVQESQNTLHFPIDGHLNEEGHKVLAAQLKDFLQAQSILPGRSAHDKSTKRSGESSHSRR